METLFFLYGRIFYGLILYAVIENKIYGGNTVEDIDIIVKSSPICKDGNEILKITVKYPKTERCPEIEEFYSSLADSAIFFCGERLAEIAVKTYDEDMKNGVFFVGYKYRFSAQPVYQCEDICAVRIKAELCRGSERLSGMSFSDVQWWELSEGKMVSSPYVLKKYFEWQKGFSKVKKNSCISIEKNRMFLIEKKEKKYVGDLLPK